MNSQVARILSVAAVCFAPSVHAQSSLSQSDILRIASTAAECAVFASNSGRAVERDRLLRSAAESALLYARIRVSDDQFAPAGVFEQFGPEFLAGYIVAHSMMRAELTLEGSLLSVTDMESATYRLEQISTLSEGFYSSNGCQDIE